MARPKVAVEKQLRQSLPRGSAILLAVSGGIDSIVLLHACHAQVRLLKLRLEVAHLDHSLRKESRKDCEFVALQAKKLGLPFHSFKAKAPKTKTNLEEWGRQTRYTFFEKIRLKRCLDLIATAHTASDVAETFLMRVVSNKELRSIERLDIKRHLIRPLLSLPRSAIEVYAKAHKLRHVEDQTNLDQKFLRNKVRHTLIPFLAQHFDARIIETLSERAQALAQDYKLLDSLCAQSLKLLSGTSWGSKSWLQSLQNELERLPKELGWRLVEGVFINKLGFNLGREHSERVIRFLEINSAQLELPNKTKLRRKAGQLVFVC